jgi:hypothetical protein
MLEPKLIEELEAMGLTLEDSSILGPVMCSAYVGRQPNGEPRFLVSVADFGDGLHWDAIRLDKWGGIGSRGAEKGGKMMVGVAQFLSGVDARDGTVRLSSKQYLKLASL